jgi:hypothetical protein
VLHVRSSDSLDTPIDLTRGRSIRIADCALAIVLDSAPRIVGRPCRLIGAEEIETDQWTIGLAAETRLFRFAFDDPDRTDAYVSGITGQVVLWTTASRRFWNWFGPIPHWLYFAPLRSQIVIGAAMLGTFLTALGLYLGIAQIKGRSSILIAVGSIGTMWRDFCSASRRWHGLSVAWSR